MSASRKCKEEIRKVHGINNYELQLFSNVSILFKTFECFDTWSEIILFYSILFYSIQDIRMF